MKSAKPYLIYPGYAFIAYPNRDSTEYKKRYNIPEAQTVIRGTLRYQGFAEFISVLVDLGFLEDYVEEAIELFLSRVNFKKNVGDHFEWVLIRVYEPNFDIDRSFCGRI